MKQIGNFKLDFINIKLLRQKLINYIENKTNYYPKNKQVYIDDFIVLSFLLGNDCAYNAYFTLPISRFGKIIEHYINIKRLKFNLVILEPKKLMLNSN